MILCLWNDRSSRTSIRKHQTVQEHQARQGTKSNPNVARFRGLLGAVPLLACLMSLPTLADDTVPPEPEGMTVCFNGKDLTDWEGDPRLWSVRDGVIHGETTTENPAEGNTFLVWKGGRTGDFDLRLSFRCNATNNSGIQYRSRHFTDAHPRNKWIVRGYQHELRNEVKFPNVSGFIYDEGGKRGRISLVGEQVTWDDSGKHVLKSDLIDQAAFEKLFKLDDWNDVVIVAKGHLIRHYLNNRLVMECDDQDPQRALTDGILALQLHAGKPMWAEFRKIRITELK